MLDPAQLPHLIRLLDDDSPFVQEAVWRELLAFGPALADELTRQNLSLDPPHSEQWESVIESDRRRALLAQWPSWFTIENEKEQLERALSLLSDYQDGYARPGRLSVLLDLIAHDFCESEDVADSRELSRYLFQTRGFRGAQSDYYSPGKSDLAKVIETRSGNPISLTCIYILVGHRLGIDIQGCNFPGHFLGRTLIGKNIVLVDCFESGRFIKANDFQDLNPSSATNVRDVVHRPASTLTIISRVLNNLVTAYQATNSPDDISLLRELIQMQHIAFEREGPNP